MTARSWIAAAGLAVCAALAPSAEAGETAGVLAARLLPAGTVLSPSDLRVSMEDDTATGEAELQSYLGLALRTTVRKGHPVRARDLEAADVIERNQIVEITVVGAGFELRAEGRALGAATRGERVRVLNLSSRRVVTGTAVAPGRVEAGR